MAPEATVVVYPDGEVLAAATAARFITKLVDIQASRRLPHVCLTGGRGGTSVLAAIAASPACQAVDWSLVEFWWSDERFLPEGDPQRNETGARLALLDHVAVDPARVHPMPSCGPDGADVGAAARAYAAELAIAASPGAGDVPVFDLCLLGLGEDGHVASLFPGRDEALLPTSVAAVRDSPKPPPLRTTFTMATIRSADEVWLIASGSGKADAVRRTLAGVPAGQAPSVAAQGRSRTYLFADRDAAPRNRSSASSSSVPPSSSLRLSFT